MFMDVNAAWINEYIKMMDMGGMFKLYKILIEIFNIVGYEWIWIWLEYWWIWICIDVKSAYKCLYIQLLLFRGYKIQTTITKTTLALT